MNHEQWLGALIAPDSQRSAAARVGVTQSTVSRQLARGRLDPELVILLARAYDVNEVDALVETGYVDPEAVALAGIPTALGHATNAQILEEIRLRTDPEAVRLLRGGDDPDVITPRFGRTHEYVAPASAAASERMKETGPDLDDVGEESQDPGDHADLP